MGSLKLIRDAFVAADDFLHPILDREEIQKSQGQSLIHILRQPSAGSDLNDDAARTGVIGQALDILARIHVAFASPDDDPDVSQQHGSTGGDPAMEDAKRRRMLHALLDLISLEGIYPSLSSGVGIPLQQRVISVLPAGVIAKQAQVSGSSVPHNEALLRGIMEVLSGILFDACQSIQPVIRGRILSDIISGLSDLAFNPNIQPSQYQERYMEALARVIDETPSSVLLPTLSSFLQADATQWFKSRVSSQISRIPLRPGGVLQTIMFMASQFAPSLGQEAQSQASNGPHFTVQAIMQISRLLSSVPQDVDSSLYFTTIAPQLLALIDGDDQDLQKTASYTIGNGILGKRAYGAPGTIGHSIFVEPLFASLTGELNDSSTKWMNRFTDAEDTIPQSSRRKLPTGTLVDSATVELAIDRLRSLALQHPNPVLVKRIVYPILLPLWGLACFCKEQEMMLCHERVMALLQTYFSISVGAQPLKKLVDNLLWDGGSTWTYAKSSNDGAFLVGRNESRNDASNVIKMMESLQGRTDLFVGLLGSDPSSEERTGDIFLHVSESWLVHPTGTQQAHGPSKTSLGDGASENLVQRLISAKVSEKLLDNFRDILSRRPLRVLELIKQVINGELQRLDPRRGPQEAGKVSLSSLANIVPKEDGQEKSRSDNESFESLSTAFSLLSTVLASAEFATSQEIKPLLESIKDRLDQLIPLLPPFLSKPGTTSSMLLEIQLTHPEHDDTKPAPAYISDLETHRQALSNLNSDLPPVQAEGFSLLSTLITKASPVLDIPATLTLLLSIITDTSESAASEEFIYLNAIKIIGTLASRHPRTVVKTLVDNYADRSEQRSLDQRLKIGEALLRTVQDLGDALTGETAKILGEGMIAVGGRRGRKPQTQRSRAERLAKEKRKKEREEPAMSEGWSMASGPSASLSEVDLLGDDDSETESPEQTVHAANIVAAWEAGASSDEDPDDLRVRASALSVLASAVQSNILGLGPVILSSAVELALATLTLEPAPESAILRRSSVILLLDILKTLDTTREERGGKDIGFGFSLTDDGSPSSSSHDAVSRGPSTIGNIPSMLRTLGFVESREADSITRGHLRALVESLEAWLEKSLMWRIGAQTGDGDETVEPRLELGDRIAGLSVDPMAGQSGRQRPRIEEIE